LYEQGVQYVPVSHGYLAQEGWTAVGHISAQNNSGPHLDRDVTLTQTSTGRPPRRLVRFSPEVVRELPDECLIRIDVNGCLAGTVLAIPDAPEELAVGWAFIHGFLDSCDDLDRVTADGNRISIMVACGEDIDRRRVEAVGWAEPGPMSTPEPSESEPFRIRETDLLRLIDESWHAFRRDGGNDGYLHVAVADGHGIRCIARDRTIDMAVAKILGWALLNDADREVSVLIVRGIVGRRLVEATGRLGISLIVTSAIPTAEAYRAATGLSLSMIGMAVSRSMGLLTDGGHITE
jgi:formate dehydrogenase accessory protein FdhD